MDSKRGGRFYRYPPLHGLPLGHMDRHTSGSEYSNYVTNYEREPHVSIREYDSWHRPSDTGTQIDPYFTHNGNPPSQRFDRYYNESRDHCNFHNPSLRPHTVNTGPAPAPGMYPLAGNRSGQFLAQGMRNPRLIPTVHSQGHHRAPIREKEVDGRPRHLNRIVPGSWEMAHLKFCGKPLSSQQKIDQLFQQRVKASAFEPLHNEPAVRKTAAMQSVGKTGGEQPSQNLIKSSPLTINQSTQKEKFVPVSSCGNNVSNPHHSIQIEQKSLNQLNFPKASVSKLSSAVTEVGNIMNKQIFLGQAGGEEVSPKPQENSSTEELDEVELTSKFKDIDLCTSNVGLDEGNAFPENDVSYLGKNKKLIDCVSQPGGSHSYERKVVDVASEVTEGVDVTSAVTGVDVTSALTKDVDVTSAVTKDVDVTNAVNGSDKSNDDFNMKDDKKVVEMEEIEKCPSSVSITNDSVSKLSKQDEESNIKEASSNALVTSESSLSRNKEDIIIKSKANDAVCRENKNSISGKKNHLEIEKESKKEALNSVTALQRRVMQKVNKPSFVKQVSDYSLALLAKKKVEVLVSYYDQSVVDKSLERTGSHGGMSNDFTVEIDTSLDNFSALARNSDGNLTNNLSVSVENKKLEDSASDELDFTKEISEYENNVCNDLGGISKEIVGIEYGNVDMHESNGSHAVEDVGTELYGVDCNKGICEDLIGDGSIELNASVDSYLSCSWGENDIEEDPSQSCGTIANVVVETAKCLQETDFSQLKKNLNIKEAFVSLTKIDVERRDKNNHQMIYKTDKQNKPVDEIQVEGNETEGSSDKLESHVIDPDQADDNTDKLGRSVVKLDQAEVKSDKLGSGIVKPVQAEVNTDKLGSGIVTPDQAEVNTDKLCSSFVEPDQAEVNTDDLGSSFVEPDQAEDNTDTLGSGIVEPDQAKEDTDKLGSSIVKPNQAEESKKLLTDGINYRRQLISLNERFSQLPNKNIDGGTEEDSEEKAYKAEFENILNKLSKKSLLGSQSEIEKGKVMEVEHERDDNMKETKLDGDNRQTKLEVGGAQCLQDDSSNEAKEMKESTENAKDKELEESSPVSFLAFSDEESDDELLRTPSAFLRSIEEINGRPVVITPTKVMDSSQNSTATTSSSDLSPIKPIAQRPGVKNKFTLDGLLADHEEKADLVREMDKINQQLQDEIKQGGFVNILNKEDAATELQITEEQKEMLKHFEVQESHICEDRPGVVVFQPQHYKSLFSSMLHPTHCGFTVGSNGLMLEKHIESLRIGQYKRVITSDIIYQCFTKISCQTPLLRWLFFIMSIHDDHQVQQGCKKILLEVLHFQHVYGHQKWTPRLTDVLSVLVNYGASLETLLPADCGSSTLEAIRGKLMQEPGYVHGQGQQNAEVSVENLMLVLKILTQCLYGPSGRYKPNDLSLLCVALCKASLDSSLKNMCAKGAFQNCITMLIRQYQEADWLKERLKLTRMLVSISDHHHNCAHIAELLPPGQKGLFLQRRFCYLVLSEILLDKTNVSDEILSSIQIQDLQVFVPKLEELLENDTYKMSSVVTLIDLCVGVHITMKSEQREQLKSLLEQVRRVRVRDNVSMLDRTRVKDMIVRMTSKWALDIQTMKGKQTKIFEYASPMKICIEQVKTLQSSGEEEENSDIDDDPPCKMQKLSQDTYH